jgi:hypothetical protein
MFIGSIASLSEILATGGLDQIDGEGFGLKKTYHFCKEWCISMKSFCLGAQRKYLQTMQVVLQQESGRLDEATPRWDVCFPNDSVDKSLARSKLLDHPRRNVIRPLTRTVTNLRKVIVELTTKWNMGIDDDGLLRLAAAVITNGNGYLVLVAAVNIVLNQTTNQKAPAMADEVMALASRVDNFVMPTGLLTMLQNVSSGMPEVQKGASPKQESPTGGKASSTVGLAQLAASASSSSSSSGGSASLLKVKGESEEPVAKKRRSR